VRSASGEVLEPANFNAPGQVVISGTAKAISWLKENSAQLGEAFPEGAPRLKMIPLQVSAPFHCSLMKPAEDEMRLVLKDTPFNDARFPIVQNVTAHETRDAQLLRDNLVKQVSGAVRWTQCVARLREMGMTNSIEFGAGKVLAGLSKKIDSTMPSPFNINALEDIKALETTVKSSTIVH
jgi:[acyl-carrier-protein] S-malonyltransferase